MSECLISIDQVMAKLGIRSPTTLAKMRKMIGFPRPLRLPGRLTRWREADVDGWIRQQAREANVETARVGSLAVH
jgi:predicted DNA-binding transcriptional regulator AlpA